MKKLLFGIMAVVLCVGLIGGAFAYFTDSQTSSGNVFSAGYAQLYMAGNDGIYHHDNSVVIGSVTNMAPGASTPLYLMYFKNAGTVPGTVSAQVSFTGGPNVVLPAGLPSGSGTATWDQFAQELVVTTVYTDVAGNGTANVAGYWGQQIVDAGYGYAAGAVVSDGAGGYLPTVYGLTKVALNFATAYPNTPSNLVTFAAGDSHWEKISLKLPSTAGNTFEGLGITISVTGTLTSN